MKNRSISICLAFVGVCNFMVGGVRGIELKEGVKKNLAESEASTEGRAAVLTYFADLEKDPSVVLSKDPGEFASIGLQRFHEMLQFYFGGRRKFYFDDKSVILRALPSAGSYGIEEVGDLVEGGIKMRLAWLETFNRCDLNTLLKSDLEMQALKNLLLVYRECNKAEFQKGVTVQFLDALMKNREVIAPVDKEFLVKLGELHEGAGDRTDSISWYLEGHRDLFKSRAEFYVNLFEPIVQHENVPVRLLLQSRPDLFERRFVAASKVVGVGLIGGLNRAAIGSRSDVKAAMTEMQKYLLQIRELRVVPNVSGVESLLVTAADLEAYQDLAGVFMEAFPMVEVSRSELPLTVSGKGSGHLFKKARIENAFRAVFDYQRRVRSPEIQAVLDCMGGEITRSLSKAVEMESGK